jgi:FkbM family methyltransferase
VTQATHESVTIEKILRRCMPGSPVRTIWEIGSRDGKDGAAMLGSFPGSDVHSFEPNPDTFPLVEETSQRHAPRMVAHALALSNVQGTIEFLKIDPEKTTTSWEDGNPGASSLFHANGEYDLETDAQTPVDVEAMTAAALIRSQVVPVPDLIWMDVQGAEGLVLEGFGDYLRQVKAIYVELSLREMYAGQAMARDVIRSLGKNFWWHSVLRTGSWQFDALFVNKSATGRGLAKGDLALRASLRSGLYAGIAYPATMRGCANAVLRPGLIHAKEQIESSDSRVLGALAGSAARACQVVARPLPFRTRQVIALAQPADPLAGHTDLPGIDVIIPCHSKDVGTLGLVLAGVESSSRNPIEQVHLVAPSEIVPDLRASFPKANVESDEDVLGEQLLGLVEQSVPRDRRGWTIQQLIKIAAATRSECEGSLILDADTVLLRERTWLAEGGMQLLSVSHEYHRPYLAQAERMWGSRAKPTGLSYVTHHQLMQKDILREMFGDLSVGLARWLSLADYSGDAALSEYHCYGTWIIRNERSRVRLAQWGNRQSTTSHFPPESLDARTGLEVLRSRFPHAYSVSFHSYMG